MSVAEAFIALAQKRTSLQSGGDITIAPTAVMRSLLSASGADKQADRCHRKL